METLPGPSRFRRNRGIWGVVSKVALCLLSIIAVLYVLDVPYYFRLAFYPAQFFGAFLGIALGTLFLTVPATSHAPRDKPAWYDLLLALLALVVGFYVAIFYPRMITTLGVITPTRLVLGAIAVLLVLEATRRTSGWVLVILGLLFILYARYTHFLPGMLYGQGMEWSRLVTFLYLDDNSLLGLVMQVTVGIVLPFILFGQFLSASGGATFLTDLAMSLVGRFRGGPAKVSVLSSSLFGTVSGSAVANVVVDGVITIPMMIRAGYKPHMAAAVEAATSTGGQIMPPVMGAAAFIIAQFLRIPYATVAIAAAIPAILYYVALFFGVHFEAARNGLRSLRREELPSLRKTLEKGWVFFIPVIVLFYTIFGLSLDPSEAAIWAIGTVILISFLRKETRPSPRKLLGIFESTGRTMLDMIAIAGVAGFVIGIVSLTGLGLSFSQMIIHLSGGNLLAMLILAAVGCIILGMGVPVTATYILVAILAAPALIQMGLDPLAAHLFVFYFGVLSFLTPPIALAVYAACTIAGSGLWRTGLAAMKLGIVAYIVPFIFVFSPALLFKGSPGEVAGAFATAVLAVMLLEAALEGYLLFPLNGLSRLLLSAGAILLMIPGWRTDVIGLGLAALPLFWQWRTYRLKIKTKAVAELPVAQPSPDPEQHPGAGG